MARGLGTSLLVIGIVLLVGGVAAVVFTEADQGDNEEQFFSDDNEDRAERNDQIRTGGWIGTAVGGLLALVGLVAMVARRS